MKKFCKFTYFFTLIITAAISTTLFFSFLLNVVDYIKAESELETAALTLLMGQSLLATVITLVVGFSLTAIVYLLYNIAFKKQKTKKVTTSVDEN